MSVKEKVQSFNGKKNPVPLPEIKKNIVKETKPKHLSIPNVSADDYFVDMETDAQVHGPRDSNAPTEFDKDITSDNLSLGPGSPIGFNMEDGLRVSKMSSPSAQLPLEPVVNTPDVKPVAGRGRKKMPLPNVNALSANKARFSWSNILGVNALSTNSIASRQSGLMPAFSPNSGVEEEVDLQEARAKYNQTSAAQTMRQQGLPVPKKREEFKSETLDICCKIS